MQNYTDEEFIAGWGQYLPYFLHDSVHVFNHAVGGRSSRLFINEGRFDKINDAIEEGDYLFIEFCHNDDATKTYNTMFNRLVALGEPDEDGGYPVIPGEKADKDYIPDEYIAALMQDNAVDDKQAVIESVRASIQAYPHDWYYPYSADGAKGSYKWFLKQYIDMARENGATPVLVTAPARTCFNADGTVKDGKGLHGGNDFAYIRTMRQIGEETHTVVLDLFTNSVKLFEKIGQNNIHRYTSIKKGINKGIWPQDFINELNKSGTVSEDTHFNKYGAWLLTKELVELIRSCEDGQLDLLKEKLVDSEYEVQAPAGLMLKVTYHTYPGKAEEFVSAMTASGLLDIIFKEDGCLQYEMTAYPDTDTVVLLEKWENEEKQKFHLQQPHMKTQKEIKDKYVRETEVEKDR